MLDHFTVGSYLAHSTCETSLDFAPLNDCIGSKLDSIYELHLYHSFPKFTSILDILKGCRLSAVDSNTSTHTQKNQQNRYLMIGTRCLCSGRTCSNEKTRSGIKDHCVRKLYLILISAKLAVLQKPAEPEQPAVVAKVNGEKSGVESPMEDDEEEEEPQQKEKVHNSIDTENGLKVFYYMKWTGHGSLVSSVSASYAGGP